jgi:hypothetical protein
MAEEKTLNHVRISACELAFPTGACRQIGTTLVCDYPVKIELSPVSVCERDPKEPYITKCRLGVK